ncbi:MAG: hypothetical protein AB3N21_02935 [Ruegeria sp.]|uniref:hypothetical protein n=1 Tax=Ruegeria sp. TaxID=1879320 RepID=UPI00349EE034
MSGTETGPATGRLKWIGICIGLIGLGVAAGWGIYRIPAPIVDRMLEAGLRHQADLWNRRVVLHLEDAEVTFRTGMLDEHDREFLALMPKASDVYRFKLLKADGRVFWSTRASDMGSTVDTSHFHSVVAAGSVYYKHEEKPVSEVDGLRI